MVAEARYILSPPNVRLPFLFEKEAYRVIKRASS